MWPSGCWRHGIVPSIPPFLDFGGGTRADFGAVMVTIVQRARDLGLVSLAALVPDSTKVRANAGKRKAMNNGAHAAGGGAADRGD